jgi:two-component system, cell cycle sensor histidine kinase PleC
VQLTAELGPDDGFVRSVRDTGIGLSPETIPLALEPFCQIAPPISRNVEGTGLGLSLVKILTGQLGGIVTIESELLAGTEVTLRFTASRTPSEKLHASG